MRISNINKDPRQLRLGHTKNNQLILLRDNAHLPPNTLVSYEGDVKLQAELPFHRSTDDELYLALRPPFKILRLPEEIVEQILKYAYYNLYEESRFSRHYDTIDEWERRRVGLSICIVSRYFHRLMHPMIYSSQRICIDHADSAIRIRGIRISSSPRIANHCTNLYIYINEPLKNLHWPDEDFFGKYSNVRTLRVQYNCFDARDALEMRQRISSHFPRLGHMEFDIRHQKYPWIDSDWRAPDKMTLPVLYEALGKQTRLGSLKIFEFTPTPFSISTPEMVNTATFTSLEMNRCPWPPSSLTEILRWPARLEHFSIRNFSNVSEQEITDYSEFESILHAHGQSLTSLGLPDFFHFPKGRPPNLSFLAHLQVLIIKDNGRNPQIWSAEDFCTNVLSAPELRKLTWNFSFFDEEYGAQNMEFDAGHVKWLIDVARLAHAQRRSLREIEIVFNPDPQYGRYSRKPSMAPWKLIDFAARVLGELGVVLHYRRHFLTTRRKFSGDIEFECRTDPRCGPTWHATRVR
ncbi:hypothetical protein P154DRAFT_523335 [Amniculicola lignicola CBS 123094]|uniref:F-box domain-containing protein n=1 Tax=Amniculicola lignicola CBS 123094 TaxID=1392246 RepID=A0A6A5WCI9_9PLEO|nr:hypothetical protein P154DRAFT_523335 [Amniculicola lignicola CBS 123094]